MLVEHANLEIKDYIAIAQSVFAIVQAIVAIIAIGVGIRWFLRRRRDKPHANISQEITHKNLSHDKIWIRVNVSVENKGEVLLTLTQGCVRLQQIAPLLSPLKETIINAQEGNTPVIPGKNEIGWFQIEEQQLEGETAIRSIEPGEKDEFQVDFIVNSDLEVFTSYVYLENLAKELGWHNTVIYEIKPPSITAQLAPTNVRASTATSINKPQMSRSNPVMPNEETLQKNFNSDEEDLNKGARKKDPAQPCPRHSHRA